METTLDQEISPVEERPSNGMEESLSVSIIPSNIQASLGSNVSFDCVIKQFDLSQLIRMYDELEFEWLKDGAPLDFLKAKRHFVESPKCFKCF